uniref:Uncharacterized protein n=1 Tax=Hydatigena taeniaeformis TaxID=6205 RepID=A0A0R3WXX6_HYDTA
LPNRKDAATVDIGVGVKNGVCLNAKPGSLLKPGRSVDGWEDVRTFALSGEWGGKRSKSGTSGALFIKSPLYLMQSCMQLLNTPFNLTSCCVSPPPGFAFHERLIGLATSHAAISQQVTHHLILLLLLLLLLVLVLILLALILLRLVDTESINLTSTFRYIYCFTIVSLTIAATTPSTLLLHRNGQSRACSQRRGIEMNATYPIKATFAS